MQSASPASIPGPLARGANGPGVVSAHYVAAAPTSSAPGHGPLTACLSLPEAWAAESGRRAQVRVPTDLTWQTTPALALALGEQARTWGVPCAGVGAAAGYGAPPTFLPGLDDRQVAYIVGVSSTFGGRLPDEVQVAALLSPLRPRGRGQPKKPRPAPLSEAQAVREALPADRWQPLTWRAHAAVVLRQQCAAVRVHWATGGAQGSPSHPRVCTGPEGGLLGARPMAGARGDCTGYCSTLPADTPRRRLVEVAHSRWPSEQCYEDAKGEWGVDPYQGRRWDGLHRHRALVMLAYSFLARQRWTPANSAGCSPLGGASSVPGDPAPGAAVAVPRRCAMAHRDQPDRPFPSQADLTK